MKYRCLTDQELQSLEPEFKQFLVSHGLMGKEWRTINEQTPEKALELVEIFSDIVFDKVAEKVEYLIHRAPQDLKLFHFEADRMVMQGVKLQNPNVNLQKAPYREDMLLAMKDAGQENVQLLSGTKAYQKSRKEEAAALINEGCEITVGDWFLQLEALRKA